MHWRQGSKRIAVMLGIAGSVASTAWVLVTDSPQLDVPFADAFYKVVHDPISGELKSQILVEERRHRWGEQVQEQLSDGVLTNEYKQMYLDEANPKLDRKFTDLGELVAYVIAKTTAKRDSLQAIYDERVTAFDKYDHVTLSFGEADSLGYNRYRNDFQVKLQIWALPLAIMVGGAIGFVGYMVVAYVVYGLFRLLVWLFRGFFPKEES